MLRAKATRGTAKSVQGSLLNLSPQLAVGAAGIRICVFHKIAVKDSIEANFRACKAGGRASWSLTWVDRNLAQVLQYAPLPYGLGAAHHQKGKGTPVLTLKGIDTKGALTQKGRWRKRSVDGVIDVKWLVRSRLLSWAFESWLAVPARRDCRRSKKFKEYFSRRQCQVLAEQPLHMLAMHDDSARLWELAQHQPS